MKRIAPWLFAILTLGAFWAAYRYCLLNSENFPGVLSAVSWPVLLGIFLITFRSEVASIILRITKFWGAEIAPPVPYKDTESNRNIAEIEMSRTDRESASATAPTSPSVDFSVWGRLPANLYWFGWDMSQTMDMLLRGAPHDKILWSIRQAHFHLKKIVEFEPSLQTPLNLLARIRSEAEVAIESDWTTARRVNVSTQLGAVIWAVGEKIEAKQPGAQLWDDANYRPGMRGGN